MKLRRILALILAFCLCLSLGTLASDAPDTSQGGRAASAPPDNSTKAVNTLGERAVLYYEYAEDGYTLTFTPAFKDSFTRQSELQVPEIGTPFTVGGLDIRVDEIRWDEDLGIGTSGIVINSLTDTETPFVFGGDTDYYEAPDGREYNSVIVMARGADEEQQTDATETAPGVGIAFNGSSLELKNVYISSAGTGRPCVHIPSPSRDNNASQLGDLICVDSTFVDDGTRALLLMGGNVWFLNSDVTSNSWGALSYDNTSTIMYVVNATVNTTNSSGYGVYDAAGCTAYFYGVKAVSGEIAVTVCRDAVLTVDSLTAADADATDPYDGSADLLDVATSRVADYAGRSFLAGAFTGINMHADMAGADTQTVAVLKDTIISTLREDVVFEDGTTYDDIFNPIDLTTRGLLRYLQWEDLAGACVVIKSHSGKLDLDGCELRSQTGVLVHTAFIYDSMASGIYPEDGVEYIGDEINFRNMTAEGDILHEDYMRKMVLSLENTSLTGKVVSGTCASWNARWQTIEDPLPEMEAAGADVSELSFDAEEIKASFIYNETYETVWGVRMSMDADSVWTVTGDSSLYSLTVAEGAQILAPEGQTLTIYTGVKMSGDDEFYDYTTGTQVDSLEPGKTYEGVVILVGGDKADGVPAGDKADGAPAEEGNLGISLNGQQMGTFTVDPETDSGSYSVDLQALLSAFGLELTYDEATGSATITDSSGLLGGLLGSLDE